MATTRPASPASSHALLRMLAFGAFGLLAARRFDETPEWLLAGAIGGAILAVIVLVPLHALLWLFNARARKEHGAPALRTATGAGFAAVVPFAVLALVAELVLGWDAVTAFAIAGLMAASGAAAVEVTRLGGRPIANAVLGAGNGLCLAALWCAGLFWMQAHGPF